MKIAVLHNPNAGDRELTRRKLLSLLRAAGYRPDYFSLKEKAWTKKHALDGAEFAVVAGGDGSVRKAALQLHESGLPLALLPLGTANNICAGLGITGSPRKIIASWTKSRRRKMDLGVARGPWGERLFIESIGVGLIGRTIGIMAEVGAVTGSQHRPERREDRLHRDANVVLALAHELHPIKLTASVDGRRAKSDDYLLLEVMNIGRAGPGLELAPKADPADGFLDLVSATAGERERLKRSLAHALGGEKSGTTKATLTWQKVRRLRLELGDCEVRIDDNVVLKRGMTHRGRSPAKTVSVEISIRPRALEIMS